MCPKSECDGAARQAVSKTRIPLLQWRLAMTRDGIGNDAIWLFVLAIGYWSCACNKSSTLTVSPCVASASMYVACACTEIMQREALLLMHVCV